MSVFLQIFTCVFMFQLKNFERCLNLLYADLPLEENNDERKQKNPINGGWVND